MSDDNQILSQLGELRQEFRDHKANEESTRAEILGLHQKIAVHLEHLDMETHEEHHRFIRSRIEREEEAAEFWRSIRIKLATTGILGAMGLLGTAVWFLLKFWFENGVKT